MHSPAQNNIILKKLIKAVANTEAKQRILDYL
jgi:hypothetical protein